VTTSVLLIGTDLGVAFWLGKALDQYGYPAFPARSISDARALLSEHHLIPGLLILLEPLEGADSFVSFCRRRFPSLRVVSMTPGSTKPGRSLPADFDIPYPARMDAESRDELLHCISRSLVREAVAI